MQLKIEVLKKMLDNYTSNIEMFQGYLKFGNPSTEQKIAEMVANRRLIAATIENDGILVTNKRNGNVFFDSMLYTACAGADTSWWG